MRFERYVVKVDGSSGETQETVCLDTLPAEKQTNLLREVFEQGLLRLGYARADAEKATK